MAWPLPRRTIAVLAALCVLAACSAEPEPNAAPDVSVVDSAEQAQAQRAALAWLALADAGDWRGGWDSAAAVFQGKADADGWAATAKQVREPLGEAQSRELMRATPRDALPDNTAGDFLMLEYRTAFAKVPGSAYETLFMAKDDGGWKVAAYAIR